MFFGIFFAVILFFIFIKIIKIAFGNRPEAGGVGNNNDADNNVGFSNDGPISDNSNDSIALFSSDSGSPSFDNSVSSNDSGTSSFSDSSSSSSDSSSGGSSEGGGASGSW